MTLYVSLSMISTVILITYNTYFIVAILGATHLEVMDHRFPVFSIPDVPLSIKSREKEDHHQLVSIQHSCLLNVCTVSCHNTHSDVRRIGLAHAVSVENFGHHSGEDICEKVFCWQSKLPLWMLCQIYLCCQNLDCLSVTRG